MGVYREVHPAETSRSQPPVPPSAPHIESIEAVLITFYAFYQTISTFYPIKFTGLFNLIWRQYRNHPSPSMPSETVGSLRNETQ